MSLNVSNSGIGDPIDRYLGVKLTPETPYLGVVEGKVEGCALKALEQTITEQRLLIEMLARRLEKRESAELGENLRPDQKQKMEQLAATLEQIALRKIGETQDPQRERELLAGALRQHMKEHLPTSSEPIATSPRLTRSSSGRFSFLRRSRSNLALHTAGLTPRAAAASPRETVIEEYRHRETDRNISLGEREFHTPLDPSIVLTASSAWETNAKSLKKSRTFKALGKAQRKALLKEAGQAPRFGQASELHSTLQMRNFADPNQGSKSIGADLNRLHDAMQFGTPTGPRTVDASVDLALSQFCGALGIDHTIESEMKTLWTSCRSETVAGSSATAPIDEAFKKFYFLLAGGAVGDNGKRVAQLFCPVSQTHSVPGAAQVLLALPKGLFKIAQGTSINYHFLGSGACVVTVKTPIELKATDPNAPQIFFVNTLKRNPTSETWDSRIGVVVILPTGSEENRSLIEEVERQIVIPIMDRGFHVRLEIPAP